MKYIKLFENFDSNEDYLMLKDVEQILITHLGEIKEVDLKNIDDDDVNPHMSDELISKVKVYKLLDSPNVRDLKSFEAHLEQHLEENLEADSNGIFWNVNLDWYTGKICVIGIGESIDDFCLEWLRERFEGAEKYVNNENQVFYYDKDKNGVSNYEGGISILYYYENDAQDKYCYINQGKIWRFLRETLGLEDYQIRGILSKWLIEKFGLDLEPKKW